MCLMLIAYKYHPDYPLILASNRDEFYSRQTEPLAIRNKRTALYGLDLEEGGTWLAANRSGRIAALTNVREPARHNCNALSRGLLVRECIQSPQPLAQYLNHTMQQADKYNGFNLIAADDSGLYYCSNRTEGVRKLDSGLYGLSNHQLDTPWPKVKSAKDMFRDVLDSDDELDHEQLFSILRTDECPPEQLMPDTGVGPVWERILAPIFIHSDIYGTRTSSLVLINNDGHLRLVERTHGLPGSPDRADTKDYSFETLQA